MVAMAETAINAAPCLILVAGLVATVRKRR
jgi:hypothetical protein